MLADPINGWLYPFTILAILCVLNAAFFFSQVNSGFWRGIVAGLVAGGSMGFYLANWLIFHYSLDPRLFLLAILLAFLIGNFAVLLKRTRKQRADD